VTGRESHSARGKHHIITRLPECERTAAYDDLLSKCLLCGACRESCPHKLETPQLVVAERNKASRLTSASLLTAVARHSLTRPLFLKGLRKAGAAADRLFSRFLPPESGLRLRLAGWTITWRARRRRGAGSQIASRGSRPGPGSSSEFSSIILGMRGTLIAFSQIALLVFGSCPLAAAGSRSLFHRELNLAVLYSRRDASLDFHPAPLFSSVGFEHLLKFADGTPGRLNPDATDLYH